MTAPVNTGGWFSVGVTVIGSTSAAVRPPAPEPSVTVNEIAAGPKYPGSLRYAMVSSSTSSTGPAACVADSEFGSAMRTARPPAATTCSSSSTTSRSPLGTVGRGSPTRSCGRVSSKPGTQTKAVAEMVGSSGCATVKGTMRRSSPTSTRIRPSSVTSATSS
ncbi:hypothetical protein CMMCAS03_14460 [Clavibacter michiganensis subsp. michiganensis]|nr:hypothetical protein CMMCAS03_14460 [Clavibacter michiganensis subsp. michiganensis]OUD92288.1 hypothetical protein CMMCAS05_08170 [Clavibacter michiganensis subsp. michiganensis]